MKKYYEVHLMQHVAGSVEDDYETVHYECEGGYTYYECKRKAKEISKHIGKVNVPNVSFTFSKREANKVVHSQALDEGLAAVKIVCYTENEYTTYEQLYYEYYKDGKVDYKVDF